MSNDNKALYLTDIAKEKNIKDPKDVLSALMPYDIIFKNFDNVDLLVERDEFGRTTPLTPSGIMPIKIKEDYLQEIFRKGCWSGKTMYTDVVWNDGNPYIPEGIICPMYVKADDGLFISIEDLFVDEENLATLENRHPDIFVQKPVTSSEPKSTGSRRNIARINETRQACEKVRDELCQEKTTFDNNKDNWNPNLLIDRGKTTKKLFMDAVKERLGKEPHRDTAVDVWKTISADLKHKGRPLDQ